MQAGAPRGGRGERRLSSDCDSGGMVRLGMVQGMIRFPHHCGQRWGIVGEKAYQSVSGSISICHVYSSGVLAAGWLLCQGFFISASWELSRSANRNPPSATPHRTLPITNLHFHQVSCYILHLILPLWSPSPTLYSPVLEWKWSESSLNRPTDLHSKKSSWFTPTTVGFFPYSTGRLWPPDAGHNCLSAPIGN